MSLEAVKSKINVVHILLLAAVLRFYQLGSEGLWIDEGYSIRDAKALASLVDVRPLYFLILRFWMHFGYSEAWLRSLSVIFGLGSVWLTYVLGRKLFNQKVGLLASFIMAVSPLHINHSQEIRMYALVTFLVLAEVLLFTKYLESAKGRDLAACIITAGLAFLVFPLSIMMFLALDLFLLIRFKEYSRQAVWWFAGQIVAGIAAIPMRTALIQSTHDYGESWTWRLAPPGALDLVRATRDFYLWRIPEGYQLVQAICDVYGFAVLALAVYGAWRFIKTRSWQTQLAVIWLVVPLAGTLVMSRMLVNVWVERYMIYASPAFYFLTALGIVSIQSRRVQVAALVCVLLLPAARLGIYYTEPNRPEWRQAVGYIESHLEEGDAIGVYRYGNRYVFDYYYDGPARWYALGDTELNRSSFDGWDRGRIRRMLSPIPRGSRRVWLVLSVHENMGGFSIERYIRRNYQVLETRDFRRIKIYLVTRKNGLAEANLDSDGVQQE